MSAPSARLGLSAFSRIALPLGVIAGSLTPPVAWAEARPPAPAAFVSGGPRLPAEPVTVEIDACVAVDHAQVRRHLAIELGTEQPVAPSEVTGKSLARVRCPDPEYPEHVELYVDDKVTAKSLSRSVDLGLSDPAVRPRLLALALAELLFASWAELLLTPQPKVPPLAAPVLPATRRATSDEVAKKLPRPLPPLGVRLLALGSAQWLFRGTAVHGGGALRVAGDHPHRLSWELDLGARYSATATALGAITSTLIDAKPALLVHHRLPHLILRAGLGLRVGAARLDGLASDATITKGATLWGPYGGPLATLGLTATASRLRMELSAEAGYVLWKVIGRVEGYPAVAIDGPFVGVHLGIGLHAGGGSAPKSP